MDLLRLFTYDALPTGCPFVVGGGLVRDSILGGRPSDIDIWLPSNLQAGFVGAESFLSMLALWAPEDTYFEVLFRGPDHDGTNGQAPGDTPVGATPNEYGDVANHWVIEMQVPGWPRVNFMRSMTQWRSDSQEFFNGLMRAFDIDHCMFFIGWMNGQSNVNTVIMPEHMLSRDSRRFRLSELHWNQWRLGSTPAARVESRLIKMYSKYSYGFRTAQEIEAEGLVIPLDQIVARPVLLSQAMRILANPHMPLPIWTNTNECTEQSKAATLANITQRYNQRNAWNREMEQVIANHIQIGR